MSALGRNMAGCVPIPLFWLARLLGMGPYTVGSEPARRRFDRGLRYEIAGVLHRIRSGRHGDGLPYWSSRRAMVGGGEFAGVPCVLLFCFLGRLAAGRARDLIFREIPPRLFRNRQHG
jgi:hypothetical protein